MRVVSPFRPFVPESVEHLRLGAFDWIAAIQMSKASTEAVHGEWFALTDVDTELPVPAFKYQTAHRRLMLWIVEVCLRYLESKDFDRDTVMISPDVLVFADLSEFFTADLGVVARFSQKFVEANRTILNSCQTWAHAAKTRLIKFYRRALAIAERLPEHRIRWGADTDPLVTLLSPITEGVRKRAGLWVRCIDERQIMSAVTEDDIVDLNNGTFSRLSVLPLTDFRYVRKHAMAAYFSATVAHV